MLSWRAYTHDKKQYRIYALNHLQKLFASSLSHYREIFDMWRGYTSVRVSQRHGTVPRFVPTTARWDLFLELRVRMMQQRQMVRVPQHVRGCGGGKFDPVVTGQLDDVGRTAAWGRTPHERGGGMAGVGRVEATTRH